MSLLVLRSSPAGEPMCSVATGSALHGHGQGAQPGAAQGNRLLPGALVQCYTHSVQD